ncbi:hypothetical protein C8J57DRAFT_1554330 [Mycena rebaudengoi]|nr:hypothetical protein C8J57DRAFT_1554330 [Mycena rebaudengoi]
MVASFSALQLRASGSPSVSLQLLGAFAPLSLHQHVLLSCLYKGAAAMSPNACARPRNVSPICAVHIHADCERDPIERERPDRYLREREKERERSAAPAPKKGTRDEVYAGGAPRNIRVQFTDARSAVPRAAVWCPASGYIHVHAVHACVLCAPCTPAVLILEWSKMLSLTFTALKPFVVTGCGYGGRQGVCIHMVYPIQAVSTWEYLGRPRVDPGTPSWRTIFELPFTLTRLDKRRQTYMSIPLVYGGRQGVDQGRPR